MNEAIHLNIILVVDDNADMREHLRSILSGNFNVITANNGMDALHKIKETTPALVLTDSMMPVMDGYDLLKEIKSNQATANIPIIFLTARAGEESRIEGWETGADDYLVKPFSTKELVVRVKAQLKMVKLRQQLEGNVRNLLLQSPVAIAVLKGPQHVFELANAMYLHLAGHNDVVGKSMRQAFPELEGTGIYERLDQVYSTGESFVANEMLVKLDKGNEKLDENYFNLVYQPSRDADGKIDGVIMHGVDVTAQVLARKKIEESEERLHLATLTSGVGIWEWNVITNKIRWDAQMFHIYGVKPTVDGFVEYSTWRNAVAPEDRAEQERILQDTVKSTGSSKRSFKIFRANDGMLCDIEAIETVRKNAQGETEWVVGTNLDITDLKRATEKIIESEKQFSTLANNIQNLAWIANGDGWIYWYNQRWYDYTGTTLEEMKGWGWQKVHHPDHVERIVEISKKLWITNEPFELTFPLRRHDGEYRWFLTRGVPVNDEKGNIISWIGTNTDIEEQKTFSEQLEEKVKERTEQLNAVNKNLEQKNIALQNLNQELEAFTYISSHDLQEPLRIIQTFAGRIIDTEKEHLSENAKDYFRRMNNAAERMRSLILDLLSFSRISASQKKFEITDLNKIVAEVKEELKEAIEEKNVSIQATELCEVNVIPFQFRQLMHNLISNALKFSKPDVPPRIIIKSMIVKGSKLNNDKLLPETKYCHICVADNGIGFEKQFTEKIFEVFQKLHSKDEYAGTGIGLAIVKKIVDNHHGIITAESELGKGATFNIYLPV